MAFGDLLLAAIKAAGMTQMGFAEAVGSSSGHITNMVKGLRTPNLEALPLWVGILGLEGEGRAAFIREAKLAHCPQDVADTLRTLLVTRDQLLEQVTVLESFRDQYLAVVAERDALRRRVAELEATTRA